MKEHYPRAEKETENNPDGLRWRIQQANTENTFNETTVCLIKLARYGAFDEVPGTGLPAAAVLGLIDTAHQIGKLRKELDKETSGHRDTQAHVTRLAVHMGCFDRTENVIDFAIGNLTERKDTLEQISNLGTFRDLVRNALGLSSGHVDEAVFNEISRISGDRKDALQQIENLGTFIGHPGATPAHVVSETVSLIEKFVDAAGRTGIKWNGRSLSTVAEDVVAKSKRASLFMESLLAAGRAFDIEFREDGNGSRILEAIRLERIEVIERMNAAEKEAVEWRQSSETWQKRALAAEARLSGPAGPADTPMPGRASFMEWLERITETEDGGMVSYAPLTGAIEEVFLEEPELPNVVEFEAPGIELRLQGKPDPDSICRLLKLVDAFTADNEAE